MIRNRILLKTFAAFLLVEMVTSVVAPAVSWALTAGPTAPEFSSFEPVDTTDMVNLATGEFIYNTPILEVPGPEGGYPLSLSYHAGILNEQESSWVGLGFTLNAGAINRQVDGYADDNFETKNKVTDYWGGGANYTKSYFYGLSAVGVKLGYTENKSQDTFKGFSTNSAVGISFDPVGLLLSATSNFSTKANGKNNVNGSSAISYASNGYKMLSTAVGGSSLGLSIDSKGNSKLDATFAGISFVPFNNYSGIISSLSMDIPVGGICLSGLTYSQSNYFTRYWSDESHELNTYGALYPGAATGRISADGYLSDDKKSFSSYAFDMYNLHDASILEDYSRDRVQQRSLVDDHTDPQKQLGGSFPAYDHYNVLGQGIGGAMRPLILENGDLFAQSLYERDKLGRPVVNHPILSYKSLRPFSNKKVDFRFLNQFSNSLQVTPASFELDDEDNLFVNLHEIDAKPSGFNNNDLNQKLAGSKHIEWFTNEEIVNGQAQQMGFVDFYDNRFDRKLDFEIVENYLQPEESIPYTGDVSYGSRDGQFVTRNYETESVEVKAPARYQYIRPRHADLNKKIGGFKVTNETGVTYHYALPVYNYNEYARSIVINSILGAPTFKESFNSDPYAYSWLLTAITGPDYVDRNNNGVLDDSDWGYWVKFDYGRWADSYQWRTPQQGYINDSESLNYTFSYGVKELYYLDAIETRSHKAIFIKSKRKDGRGVTSRLEGGSRPRNYKMHYNKLRDQSESKGGDLNFTVSPVSTMKLDAIYLFNKNDLSLIQFDKARGEKYMEAPSDSPHVFPYKGETIVDKDGEILLEEGKDFIRVKYHNGDMVYDDDDIHDLPVFRQKAIRIVEFQTDYSLANNTNNSFGYYSDLNGNCSDAGCTSALDKRIGMDFEWPLSYLSGGFATKCIEFPGGYPRCCLDKRLFYSKEGVFGRYSNNSGTCPDAGSSFAGSSIEYPLSGKLTLTGIKFLGVGGADMLPATKFSYHNNVNYRYLNTDEWGYYKSDAGHTERYTKRITPESSAYIKAWSLKSVDTPLGKFEIEFEPNQYHKSVYNDFSTFGIADIKPLEGNKVEIFFRERWLDLGQWFTVGKAIDMNAIIVYNLSPVYDKDVWAWLVQSPSSSASSIASVLTLGPSPFAFSIGNAITSLFGSKSKGIDYYVKGASAKFKSNAAETIVEVRDNSIVLKSATLYELLTRSVFKEGTLIGRDEIIYKDFYCVPFFLGGLIKSDDPDIKYAGGVRVSSISMLDANGRKSKTVYEYKSPLDGRCSGVTSYKPYDQPLCRFASGVPFFDAILTRNVLKEEKDKFFAYQSDFQELMNAPYAKILSLIHEVPAPGAVYEYVTVRNFVDDVEQENHTTYHFKVFDESMVERVNQDEITDDLRKRIVTIKNSSNDVGSLLDVQTFDSQNKLLKSLTYNYLFDDNDQQFEQPALDSKQGIIEQSFHKYFTLSEYNVNDDFYNWAETNFNIRSSPQRTYNLIFSVDKALITKRQDRSNAITSIKEVDYQLGTSSETKNYAFDFITGKVLKSISTDSYGNTYMTVSEPARTYYPSMGLKIFNPLNAHMLTQTAAAYSYKVNDDYEPIGLLGASIQTWTDKTPVLDLPEGQNVWRQGASYQWNGELDLNSDGTYSYEDFSSHSFSNWDNVSEQQDLHWEQTGEPTLYDVYSHSLEAKDINGNYASVRMDAKEYHVIASASNARYNEIVFAGAESYEGSNEAQGSASPGQGNVSGARAHTGQYSLLVDAGETGFSYTLTPEKTDLSKKYRASVWVYAPGLAETQAQLDKLQFYYTINGEQKDVVHPILQKNKSKSWYLMNLDITPNGTDPVFIGVRNQTQRGVYFDDFRVQPLNSSVTAYVYDPSKGELNYILDNNNFYTKFEYDAIGRLIRTSKELLNFDFGDGNESFRADAILKEQVYNYHKNH